MALPSVSVKRFPVVLTSVSVRWFSMVLSSVSVRVFYGCAICLGEGFQWYCHLRERVFCDVASHVCMRILSLSVYMGGGLLVGVGGGGIWGACLFL